MPEEPEDDQEGFEKPPSFFPNYPADHVQGELDLGEPVEVAVEGVFFTESKGAIQRFVVVSDGERKLPIMSGGFEATAISMALEGTQPDRPLTHDLIRVLLEKAGTRVLRVVIDDIWNKTYYAKLHLEHDGEEFQVDCRPSDAIAIALRCEAQILVSDGILEQAGD